MTPTGPLAVILAAGEGSRYGGGVHKLLDDADGVPLVVRAVRAALDAGLGVLVVTGGLDVEPVLRRHGAGAARVVANPRWADGLAASLGAGLDVARSEGWEAAVIGLADMPGVSAADWSAVAAEAATPVAVVRWDDGHRSPPARLHRSVWDDLPTAGDAGARILWSARPELVTDVPRPGPGADVDTRADLDRWNRTAGEPAPPAAPPER